MSLQAGVLHLDGRPVPPHAVASMAKHLDQLSHDTSGEYLGPGIAMLYRGRHVTPEDRWERQPFKTSSPLAVTWDGRLDNRDDLLFQLSHLLNDERTDVALATAAYRHWGADAFPRLIGDWSLVIWDETECALTLASDFASNRPIYYSATAHTVHWSTSLAELVERLELDDDFEPRFILGYITSAIPSDVTPYRGVVAVPPAHTLRWSRADGPILRRFWAPVVDDIRYADVREYDAHLRFLLTSAVAARLRSATPAWAELSGGLDSSTIVCIADRLRAAGAAPVSPLETVSYVTDVSPESDERRFIAAVEEQRGRSGHHVKADTLADLIDDRWGRTTPLHPSGTSLGMLRLVQQSGGRVLLSGNPGDLVMMNYPESIGGILEALRPWPHMRVLSLIHEWCFASQKPVWPLLSRVLAECWPIRRPQRLVRQMLRELHADARNAVRGAAGWFHLTDHASREWYDNALSLATDVTRAAHPSKFGMLRGIRVFADQWRLRTCPEATAVTYTHPYMARPVVQFMLAVPTEIACRPGQPRLLMRRTFGEILPSRVARRFSKGYAPPFTIRKLRRWMPADLSAVDTYYLVQAGYVDAAKLRTALEDVRSGKCLAVKNVEAILRLERWFELRQHKWRERARAI